MLWCAGSSFELLVNVSTQLASAVRIRFLLERAPFPPHRHSPLVADGVTPQSLKAATPSELQTHFDIGDLAISIAFARLEIVLRGGRPADLVTLPAPSLF